ncbi:MAG: hypothetical protein PF503_19100, partial [Desulfobacula sp.]|nr:hypothetical protein [Desulfobacula sp.]
AKSCQIINRASCTVVHSGFKIFCALYMGNFSPKHGVFGQTLAKLQAGHGYCTMACLKTIK